MTRKLPVLGFAALFTALVPGVLRADGAEDDLAIVRKAVGAAEEDPAARPVEAPPPTRAPEARWLRVRIVEKGPKKAKVAINLPLGFARSLDASWHVRTHGRRGKGASLGDILRALDSGQSLVEIEDVDATVRIWVE